MKIKTRKVTLTGKFNDYIKGRISGIIMCFVGEKCEYPHTLYDDTVVFEFDATDVDYTTIKDLLITSYGNMNDLELGFIEF